MLWQKNISLKQVHNQRSEELEYLSDCWWIFYSIFADSAQDRWHGSHQHHAKHNPHPSLITTGMFSSSHLLRPLCFLLWQATSVVSFSMCNLIVCNCMNWTNYCRRSSLPRNVHKYVILHSSIPHPLCTLFTRKSAYKKSVILNWIKYWGCLFHYERKKCYISLRKLSNVIYKNFLNFRLISWNIFWWKKNYIRPLFALISQAHS